MHPTHNIQSPKFSWCILCVQIIVSGVICEPCISRRGNFRGSLAFTLWEPEVVSKPTGLL
jgi:hypothetical protein